MTGQPYSVNNRFFSDRFVGWFLLPSYYLFITVPSGIKNVTECLFDKKMGKIPQNLKQETCK